MSSQYSILNQCLKLISQSHFKQIDKLEVEIQLIKLKRLLLNECVYEEVASKSFQKGWFETLLTITRKMCYGDVGNGASDLIEHLREMVKRLSSVSIYRAPYKMV